MTASELNSLQKSIWDSLRESAREQEAETYLRQNFRQVVGQLRQQETVTMPVSGGDYRVTRAQMRKALER